MEPEPSFVQETLNWCNERRAEKDKQPLSRLPRGNKGSGRSCPCGAATELYVGTIYWHDYGLHSRRELPECVKEFVMEFDHGRLPQYDLHPDSIL